jgi:branched-chain amino acid transport system ATP-binding protein
MTGPLLRLEGVVAGYGQSTVLKGVDLALTAGEVTCLIGPNGAGKSTVLKTVSGLLRPRQGSVWFEDTRIDDLSPKDRLRRGIVHVPQDRSLFPAMSVRENVMMGAHLLRDRSVARRRLAAVAAIFPIVQQRRHTAAGSLSGGEQKIVELARTLMLEPRLILLDEPSIGLDPRARKMVFASVRRLVANGRTVLLVEQNARSGLAAADRGAVLEGGVVCIEGTGTDLLDDPEVARLYLGAAAVPAHGLAAIANDTTSKGGLTE